MDTSNKILPPGLEQFEVRNETKKSNDELGQKEFLELMLTQIRHQDPLNPTDSSDFLSQLAQFGTVNGITELQSSFDQFAASLQSSQALQASTLVGRKVLVEGDVAELDASGTVQAAVDLESSTSALIITVSDSAGQLMKQINLGEQTSGTVQFTWDGLDENGDAVPPGAYKITAQSFVDDGFVNQTTLVQAKVDSVTLTQDGQGPLLNLHGLGTVTMNDVKEVM